MAGGARSATDDRPDPAALSRLRYARRMAASFDSHGVTLLERSILRSRRREGRLFADERGLWFEGQLLAARSEMVTASAVPRDHGGAVVRVEHPGRRRAELVLPHLAAARELLRVLGFDGGQQALVVRLPSRLVCDQAARERFRGLPFGVTAVAALVIVGSFGLRAPAFTGAIVLLWALAMLSFLGALLAPAALVIGADGVLLRWAGRGQYIPYSDIRVIHGLIDTPRRERDLLGVQIALAHGAPLRLWTSNAAQVYERLDEAVQAWWRRDAAERAALSGRRDRGTREWLSALRELPGAASVGYRELDRGGPVAHRGGRRGPSGRARRGGGGAAAVDRGGGQGERLRRRRRPPPHPRLRWRWRPRPAPQPTTRTRWSARWTGSARCGRFRPRGQRCSASAVMWRRSGEKSE